jgi:flagellar hook-associated protein 3 FlgL
MISPYRVTERSLAAATLAGLQGNLSRLGSLQQQLSSGKLISRPSDSPTGTVSAMQLRGDVRQVQQFSRNADDGKGWLTTVDQALSGAVDMVHRARNLVLQGMSSGSADPGARDALASETDQLRQSLLGVANTTYLGRPVFGGTTAATVAFDSGGTYVGDSGSVLRTVSDGAKVRVDTDGQAVFGTGQAQLFTVLSDITTHLRTDPDSLSGDLDRLDTTMRGMQGQLADVGGRYNRLTQLGQAATDQLTTLQSELSDVEDVDLPQTIMELQLQQTAYQTALGATARAVQPSLIDFLR